MECVDISLTSTLYSVDLEGVHVVSLCFFLAVPAEGDRKLGDRELTRLRGRGDWDGP